MPKIIIALSFCFIILNMSYSVEALSNGYKDIKLGMTKEEVKSVLEKSADFEVKKEEVLTMRLEPDTEIISAEGYGFIIQGYFHFYHEQLYQIFLKISEKKIGYYFLLKELTGKYGKPNIFKPKKAIWENDTVRIVLEKPCSLKYIYLPVWKGLLDSHDSEETLLNSARKKFSDDL